MKTSKKILLAFTGFVLLNLAILVLLLRKDLQAFKFRNEPGANYQTVNFENFEELDFSANWSVKIKQGKEFKVETSVLNDSKAKPSIQLTNGILYFIADTIDTTDSMHISYAKITLPLLKTIKTRQNTKIRLDNFDSDSLHIILENGGSVTGENNNFKKLTYKTSGNSILSLSED